MNNGYTYAHFCYTVRVWLIIAPGDQNSRRGKLKMAEIRAEIDPVLSTSFHEALLAVPLDLNHIGSLLDKGIEGF